MDWVCVHDGDDLAPRDDGWRCSECDRHYEAPEGIPIFARDESGAILARRPVPLLDELWGSMRERTVDEATAVFCGNQGCTRAPYTTDWKLFFAPRPEGTTLEIGAGFGDDTVELAAGPGGTISIVPTLVNARIVNRQLEDRDRSNGAVIVMNDLSRLPLADGSVDAIAMEDAAAPAFGLTNANLSTVAAEWKRVLKPEGSVFVGVANSYLGIPGARRLMQAVRSRAHSESMNRSIKRVGSSGGGGLGPGRTLRTMTGQGFSRPVVHAPLPDENDAQVVIPVSDARAVRYFLHNLIRKNSAAIRMAVHAADLLVALNLFRHLVPYYYLVFRNEAAPESSTTAAR